MALSCTPIPPDPGYESTCSFHFHGNSAQAATRGRIRPEAADIAVMHRTGSVGRLFMADPIPSQSRVKHSVPKNHYKENFKRILKIQAQSKEKQMELQKPVTVLRKSIKYDSVPPKVTVFAQSSCTSATPSVPDGPLPKSQAEQTLHHKQSCDVHVHDNEKSKKNFLAMNIECAARAKVRRPPSQQQLAAVSAKREKEFSNYKRGMIPQYLQERKEEWRKTEEQRIASLPDPSIPPGHTMMPDKERRSTLSVLQEYLSVLVTELQALPLHSDTLRVQKKKAQLEGKLAEIEDAVKIFSKPKVFIKVDD